MNLLQEANQIVEHAQDAYRSGEITAEQYRDVTRIPLKDLQLELARIQQIQDDSATALLRGDGQKLTVTGHEYVRFFNAAAIAFVEYTLPAPECVEIVTPNKTMEAGNDLE